MTDNGKKGPIGAVMVVGGGIAGMQASLDLADAGFKVYMIETKSAIGGHMAQLDKTFPTNDCAMCSISPKLVECGRHLNIDILTDTEVVRVDGEAGEFTVTLRRKPRYIDVAKCVGCGDCATACPITLPSEYEEGLAPRRAAYRLYPQAIPAAYAIEKRGVAPCRDACPMNQRAQGYIALIREGRFADAYRTITEDNPFPSVCGRVCNHRCEDACSRGKWDAPVNIMALKRFIADWVYNQQMADGKWQMADDRSPMVDGNDKPSAISHQPSAKVAIIGAGPAGLTAAQDLIRMGHAVTVFEALPVAGGMMRVGVPAYKLPPDLVDLEVQRILDLGVDLRLNTRVEDAPGLLHRGYDAVFMAIGSHRSKKLPIPGADHPDVTTAVDLLRQAALGEITREENPVAGKHVLVLGGGNVAIDAAMTSVRLGAAGVAMSCLESYDTMPAHPHEIAEAEAEGIKIFPARSFTRILVEACAEPGRSACAEPGRSNGGITGVEAVHVSFMRFEEDGRLTLETVPGSEHVLPCDYVVFSIGQGPDLTCLNGKIEPSRRRTVAIDEDTLTTNVPGVFAGGDAVTGVGFIVDAIAAGHKAAQSIDAYLRGETWRASEVENPPKVELSHAEVVQKVVSGQAARHARATFAELPADERKESFVEFKLGLTEEQAMAEARRCLECGICSECLSCVYACQANAIIHDMVERQEQIQVGAVILAPGYEVYNARLSEEFGFGRYPNVVTALQFERLLSASGPTGGHVKRPSDGLTPKKIAFLQCIGSRDQSHDYCSAVCCMYAAKEAIMAKEHEPDTEVHVFMMDMRAFSKGYEEYYHRARDKYGVQYIRCRVSELKENSKTRNLIVRYVPSDGVAGQRADKSGLGDSSPRNSLPVAPLPLIEEEFDLVVLSVGMEMSDKVKQLGQDLGIALDDYGFCHTVDFAPLETSRPGIFAVGPFVEPKDIPETVVEASGAAAEAGALLAEVRGALARKAEYPPERDVSSEEPRVGVFVCHCGSNIGGFLDVPGVAEYARTLPGIVHAEANLYTCSQDTIAHITETIKELGLNRVVVASCTPRTHEPLFQDSLRAAGLNPYLFEMANIRNQCSWVHSHDWDAATSKARELMRMSVARVVMQQPLQQIDLPLEKSALIIGGGVAGLTAARSLAEQGFSAHLVERTAELGGNLTKVHFTLDHGDAQAFLDGLVQAVESNPRINLHTETELIETRGFVGNFTSLLQRKDGQPVTVQHGVTIVATGGQEWRGDKPSRGASCLEPLEEEGEREGLSGDAYMLGQDARVMTQGDFEAWLSSQGGVERGVGSGLPIVARSVVMIQCVGPAERYCGRICCTTALKNAIRLKQVSPDTQVTVLYKDIRAYGFKERLYTDARRAGVLFIRYDDDHKPVVESGPQLSVKVWEPMLGQKLTLHPDLLILSTPVVPSEGARKLATILKVPVDLDGWFLEAHPKLRPVDFASEGVFMAGMAHYPKLLRESITQAQAAAARAATILSRPTLRAGGVVAMVDEGKCTGCLTCVRACPYGVPVVNPEKVGVGGIIGAADINPAACQGCGTCASECPAKAIQLLHYTDVQVVSKVDALFQSPPAFVPLAAVEVVGA